MAASIVRLAMAAMGQKEFGRYRPASLRSGPDLPFHASYTHAADTLE